MSAVKHPLALACLSLAPMLAVAGDLTVRLTAATDYSSNPQKLATAQSGRDDSVAVAVAFEDNLGGNQVSAAYSATQTASSGASNADGTRVAGRLNALIPVNSRLDVSVSHSAEQVLSDPTLASTTSNQRDTHTLSVSADFRPFSPGRGDLLIIPEMSYAAVTDGTGEDVRTTGLEVRYEYALDPVTLIAPYARVTNTNPELSERLEYRGGGVRVSRSLRELSYFAELGRASTDRASGAGTKDTEYSVGASLDRAVYAVSVTADRSVQAARPTSLVQQIAAQLGIQGIGVSQAVTRTLGTELELRRLCERCSLTLRYDQVEQRFSAAPSNDRDAVILGVSGSYELSRASVLRANWGAESTEFSSNPSSNFDTGNWGLAWDYSGIPGLSLTLTGGFETRDDVGTATDYDEWTFGASVTKTL
ncbi:hypothetical protein GH975_05795 [Litorivicinus lipolyticus]|uniref:TIGR03016 family PEP-CTERM system-associated outer membrane protein n=1 Tax=Litorivicinus lipolyticus TaxID=418701 RepID=A0A5Q2QCQ4_9GAMM|nr:hypothetical protein [Litorivicinus lipolyticus]QGG80111.1 hypothetical protein GH975_05795 [Litorivicinus lipolyticus]